MGVFVSSDTIAKLMFDTLPLFELIMLRGLVGVVLAYTVIHYLGQRQHLPSALNRWVVARGVAEGSANAGFMLAIKYMPIADVTSIVLNAPLIVLLAAWLLYGETLSTLRMGLIAVGAVGALLVAQPGSSTASPYAALCLAVAFCVAFRDIITRKVPADVPALVAAFTVLACMTIIAGLVMFATETPIMPRAAELGLITIAAALIVAGHAAIYYAWKTAQPRAVAPFMYSVLVWSTLSGVLLFGDRPNALAIAGMALIVFAGVAVMWTERQKA
jgi:drug/metabolite transporter (DMT)-like permease